MKYKITLKGKVYEVEVEKGEAMLLSEYEIKAPEAPKAVAAPVAEAPAAKPVAVTSASGKGEPVNCPLSGTVVNIKVNVGDTVKAGDVIVILEAMKMENDISSPRDGTVASILVNKGATVTQGMPLLELA